MPPIDKSKPNMSKTARFKIDLRNVPGPGAYQEDKHFGSPKGYSMRARTNLQNKKLAVPGPGTYEHKTHVGASHPTTKGSPSKSFGKLLNNSYLAKTSRAPGPGSYELKLGGIKKNAPKFSMRARTERPRNKMEIPAPSHYTPLLSRSTPSFSFRKRTLDLSGGKRITPGPQYDVHSKFTATKRSAPSFSMRKKCERDLHKHKRDHPGPDKYTPSLHYVHTRAPNEARAMRHSVSLPQLTRAY